MDDLTLLRAYEPIVRYTDGELFFPHATQPYVAECDLWATSSRRATSLVVSHGELSNDRLADVPVQPDQRLYMRFVQQPYSAMQLASWRAGPGRSAFRASGRLARVGLFARILDAALNASLVVRGKVPGGTAAAAVEKYRAAREADPRHVYHGRVVRQDGWIVLHYLFFYFMNDWRSTFEGANDHEADWEQVLIYLEDRPDGPLPVWCAAAAHDFSGDDLRRRWDDPLLMQHGDHVILFAGAGSHASYLEPGEYITTAPLPASRPIRGLFEAVRSLWRDVLRQGDPGDLAARVTDALSVPFVDYARGDGLSIGPGQPATWGVEVISDRTPWVDRYRGLFGLDTYDRFAGERAPAGPKYDRDGMVRQSWNDPLGWAGLSKVVPPHRAPGALAARIEQLEGELTSLRAEDASAAVELTAAEQELRGLEHGAAAAKLRDGLAEDVRRRSEKLAEGRRDIAALEARIDASRGEQARLERGKRDDPRSHLRNVHRPLSPELDRYGAVLEFWSAVGVGILLLVVVGLIYVVGTPIWVGVGVALAVYLLIEAILRSRLTRLLVATTVVLAVVALAVLVFEFVAEILIGILAAIALVAIADNIRELRRRAA